MNNCPCPCHKHGAIHCWCFRHPYAVPLWQWLEDLIPRLRDWRRTSAAMALLYGMTKNLGGRE